MLQKIKQEYVVFISLALALSIVEFIFRMATVTNISYYGIVISTCYACIISAIFSLILCAIKSNKNKKILLVVFLALSAIFYSSQIVYNTIFHTYYTIYSLTHGGQVLQFWRDILLGLKTCLPFVAFIILICVLASVITLKSLNYTCKKIKKYKLKPIIVSFVIIILVFLLLISIVIFNTKDQQGAPYEMFFITNSIDGSVREFGLSMAQLLDAERLLFGFDSRQLDEQQMEAQQEQVEIVYEPSVTVDLEALIASEENSTIKEMHEYFSSVTPTLKNEMTGIFEGKNLIMICAEGYTTYAAHPIYTPTLYKLQTEGFIFDNFYNPIWGVSTSDGEYVTCQSLIPKAGVWSMKESSSNALPFTMGNQFSKLGYKTLAYHNHYAEYYGRTQSHPNMGYKYKGLGTGLRVKEQWPESDLEMIELTTSEYLTPNENGIIEPFHVYYMTVSGHLNYNFTGQMMCRKHKDDVADLEMSEPCKAYIACHMELDQALARLLSDLEAAGVLEDTVIVMSGDHYPYGLTTDNISEFLGHPVEQTFELYKSNFIIYNAGTPQVKTSKYCSSMDIIPTVSNLFGLPYDSRLLMGKDIFSDSYPLVIFKDKSWITNRCFYNATTKEIIEIRQLDVDSDTFVLSDAYIQNINNIVTNKFNYSRLILEKDYYRYIVQ